jgi:hypothetical protein
MKILHLSLNDKFINAGYTLFENIYPRQNEFWIYEVPAFKPNFKAVFPYTPVSFFNLINPFFLQRLKTCDLVVIHALTPHWITLINHAPQGVKFLWLGWGYDYMQFLYESDEELFLPETRAIYKKIQQNPSTLAQLKKIPKRLFRSEDRQNAIARISAFNTVLEEEYNSIKNKNTIKHLPPYISWNYGTLEDTLVKNFIGQRVKGRNILLGNSADLRNNHIDAFKILKNAPPDQKIICPLSYAGGSGTQKIVERGGLTLQDRFQPLLNFMTMDEYLGIIKSCGFVVMNHMRQQGLATIIQMMYMGAKIFLREENPCYNFFKNNDAVIFSVQDLEKNPDLLETPLSEQEIQTNIKVLEKFWSRDVINAKTKAMVEFTISHSQKVAA